MPEGTPTEEVVRGMPRAEAGVVVLSEASSESEPREDEVSALVKKDRPIIPAVLDMSVHEQRP